MRAKQSGSAHIVIIIILIIALFATLGVVFYQNFVAKNVANQKNDQTQPVKKDTAKTTRMAFDGTIYAFDYPATWMAKVDKGSSDPSVTTTLTNPDQTVQIKIDITDGGIGGTCDYGSNLKVSYYKVYPNVVAKLTGQPLYIVETMYDAPGGGYNYAIGLTLDGGATHSAVGDLYCNVIPVGIASNLVLDNGKVVTPLIVAKILFPKVTKDSQAIPEMQPVKDLLKTNDYKAALKILESARKE